MAPRPLCHADLPAVATIEAQAFPDPWSRQAFAEMLTHQHVCGFGFDDGEGTLVGYGLCSLGGDEGEILNLAVQPRARGRGVGSALLEAMLDWLRGQGASCVFLEVRPSNHAAIELYRRAGFSPLGVRDGYYRRPREDALTMVLELGAEEARK
ncbi:MAG: ribosomal protein S18-alanine N-acetyltransferase [Gemmatimonadetes bacterium]|nr:ribosomal protein S18-alanine N-acetyltransferase [Gemmatimonadota bacterium]